MLALGPPALIVDAADVTFCSARALTVLLTVGSDAHAAGVPFALVARRRALLRPLARLDLHRVLRVHPTLEDALRGLDTSRP
ncbi:hypothetical protein CFP71_07000 [Amycolatopsis thailandensis]|uniref:STAS domain-containing protein n=1 Tax=Amycolatopsis thailandensis TaxID=589330 RepID=A0A229SFF8_9PSEU|nr:STAS domain-containing protein [Amycolatopsis thailandensis]OXM57565.1 hypothetical protein CFP71_07000 [Amycolatopsis thailandensis]